MTPTEWCAERGIDIRVYNAWLNMKQRCTNPNIPQWKDYGGRGIGFEKCWKKFENFSADVRSHPGKGWSLDRPDNDGNYGPDNWQWSTRAQQNRNRRYGSKRKLCLKEASIIRRRYHVGSRQKPGNALQLAAKYGVSRATIYDIAKQRSWT